MLGFALVIDGHISAMSPHLHSSHWLQHDLCPGKEYLQVALHQAPCRPSQTPWREAGWPALQPGGALMAADACSNMISLSSCQRHTNMSLPGMALCTCPNSVDVLGTHVHRLGKQRQQLPCGSMQAAASAGICCAALAGLLRQICRWLGGCDSRGSGVLWLREGGDVCEVGGGWGEVTERSR